MSCPGGRHFWQSLHKYRTANLSAGNTLCWFGASCFGNGAFCRRGQKPTCPPYPQTGGNRPPQTFLGGGNYPVGMGYVPIQSWQQPYALETAFRRGTIFPDLDLPFMMGGAC